MTGLAELLAAPVSGGSLALFRICLGTVMALEAYALCVPDPAAISLAISPLQNYYTGSNIAFHFPFHGFGWLPLLPPIWIYAIVGLLALGGLSMAAGFCYRLSATIVCLAWGYLFAVESTRTYWQSHYYLEMLLTFVMLWLPAARCYSVDAWLARRKSVVPGEVPYWTITLLRWQLVITYFYAGVAKFSKDWVLDAVPVRWFLADPDAIAPFRRFMTEGQFDAFATFVHHPATAYFISYTGLVFDLAIGFLLLIRRTRIFGLILMFIFHATNHTLIFDDIGWFPLVGVTTALIFLDPDWPARFAAWLRRPRLARPDWRWFVGGGLLFPVVGAALGWKLRQTSVPRPQAGRRISWAVASFFAVWLSFQTLMPLRHYVIAGDSRFTYEGMSFSWRLKAEVRHAFAHQLYVGDRQIIGRSPGGGVHIDWSQWRGDRTIYRVVSPSRIDWSHMPEVVAVLEPITGERFLYNPYSGLTGASHSESWSRDRALEIWRRAYRREPQIHTTMPLPELIDAVVALLQESGGREDVANELVQLAERVRRYERGELEQSEVVQTYRRVQELFEQLVEPGELAEPVMALLRRGNPFGLLVAGQLPATFLVLEDTALLKAGEMPPRIDRQAWLGPQLQQRDDAQSVVHVATVEDARVAALLPMAFIMDVLDQPARLPMIRWNSGRDLTASKYMHTSAQPFYLRRYARRVADLWYEQYGRRPSVHALTQVSLNGRPHQPLVDPSADLASVDVSWLSHNPWILQMETERIPRDVVEKRGPLLGTTPLP